MQSEMKKKIVDQLNAKMATKEISQNVASRQIGISGALLSQMLSGKDDKISDEKWLLAQAWTGFSGWQKVTTKTVQRVFNICRDAQRNKKALAIADEPGVGKSTALKWYADVTPAVCYIEAEEYWTKKVFLQKILKAFGAENEGSISELVDAVINQLTSTESPLLIIDEADKLKDGVLQLFKTFYNKTEGMAGFILAGAPYFRERFTKGCNKNKQAYKEIRSRLGGQFVRMVKLSAVELKEICLQNGVLAEDLPEVMEDLGDASDLRVIKRVIEVHLIKKELGQKAAA